MQSFCRLCTFAPGPGTNPSSRSCRAAKTGWKRGQSPDLPRSWSTKAGHEEKPGTV